MMEALIPGLIIAAVSGVTFVAYKHPSAYQRITIPIRLILLLAFCCTAVWNFAVGETARALDGFVEVSKGLEAIEARRSLEFPFGWLFGGYIGIVLYFKFLSFLPETLSNEVEPPNK